MKLLAAEPKRLIAGLQLPWQPSVLPLKPGWVEFPGIPACFSGVGEIAVLLSTPVE